jgi:hypothetical protein
MKNPQSPDKAENPTMNSSNDLQADMESPSRRQFLSVAGGFTAATLAAGGVGLSSLTGAPGTRAETRQSGPTSLQRRRARALEIRKKAAFYQLGQPFPDPQNNGDEDRYPTGFASYSKGLPHNNLGEVDQSAYQKLLQAINSSNPSDFDQILCFDLVPSSLEC